MNLNSNNFKNASFERERRRKEKKENRFYSKKNKMKFELRIHRLKEILTNFVLLLKRTMKDARENLFSNFKKLIDE